MMNRIGEIQTMYSKHPEKMQHLSAVENQHLYSDAQYMVDPVTKKEQVLWFTAPLIRGPTFGKFFLNKEDKFPRGLIAPFVTQLIEAVYFLHTVSADKPFAMSHGDLHQGNIMVDLDTVASQGSIVAERAAWCPRVKLIDFGGANVKHLDSGGWILDQNKGFKYSDWFEFWRGDLKPQSQLRMGLDLESIRTEMWSMLFNRRFERDHIPDWDQDLAETSEESCAVPPHLWDGIDRALFENRLDDALSLCGVWLAAESASKITPKEIEASKAFLEKVMGVPFTDGDLQRTICDNWQGDKVPSPFTLTRGQWMAKYPRTAAPNVETDDSEPGMYAGPEVADEPLPRFCFVGPGTGHTESADGGEEPPPKKVKIAVPLAEPAEKLVDSDTYGPGDDDDVKEAEQIFRKKYFQVALPDEADGRYGRIEFVAEANDAAKFWKRSSGLPRPQVLVAKLMAFNPKDENKTTGETTYFYPEGDFYREVSIMDRISEVRQKYEQDPENSLQLYPTQFLAGYTEAYFITTPQSKKQRVLWTTFPLIYGPTLFQVLMRYHKEKVPRWFVAPIMVQLLEAVLFMHIPTAGKPYAMWHADLHAGNIMIDLENGVPQGSAAAGVEEYPSIKIIDFGEARVRDIAADDVKTNQDFSYNQWFNWLRPDAMEVERMSEDDRHLLSDVQMTRDLEQLRVQLSQLIFDKTYKVRETYLDRLDQADTKPLPKDFTNKGISVDHWLPVDQALREERLDDALDLARTWLAAEKETMPNVEEVQKADKMCRTLARGFDGDGGLESAIHWWKETLNPATPAP